MNVRIVQLDGALPNLALMRLADFHKKAGDDVVFTREIMPTLFEPASYERVYASAIFDFSAERVAACCRQWPNVIIGGTGVVASPAVEEFIGGHAGVDYSAFPDFDASIGFTQRGCRLACKFCVVPGKEGKNKSVATIADIWRGEPHAKKLHLLDNDFFGQSREQWRARVREIVAGGFRVCLSQGVNVRLIDDEAAEALASMQYRDTKFKERRLYTAWDNLKDERVFFDGVARLVRAGVPTNRIMTFMLVGFDIEETWERIWHRFRRMTEAGIEPYPMVYDKSRRDLVCFQRWVITGLYRVVEWPAYERETKTQESLDGWLEVYGKR